LLFTTGITLISVHFTSFSAKYFPKKSIRVHISLIFLKIIATGLLDEFVYCADRDGVAKAAQNLGIAESMLYSGQAERLQTIQSVEEQKLQQAENMALLKWENARLEDATTSSNHSLPVALNLLAPNFEADTQHQN
jgi:hypothetical protein